jgi:hypothetical protein
LKAIAGPASLALRRLATAAVVPLATSRHSVHCHLPIEASHLTRCRGRHARPGVGPDSSRGALGMPGIEARTGRCLMRGGLIL